MPVRVRSMEGLGVDVARLQIGSNPVSMACCKLMLLLLAAASGGYVPILALGQDEFVA